MVINMKLRLLRLSALALVLLALTAYVLLDTFVIEHKLGEVASPSGTVPDGEAEDEELIYEVLDGYSDEHISVMLKHYREYETDIYVADVRVDSPEYLRCALAKDTYGRNVKEKTSDMAERVGAIVAVNGDYYGAREMGFVIRNGVLHRVAPDTDLESLVIMDDGSFKVVSQQTTRAIDLFKSGARHAFTFGPGLLSEGEITVSRIDEVDQSMKSNPRTAIGQIGENHYVLVVSDGRTDASYGLSLYNLAKFMKTLGVKVGYNLDGGGSSTMYFKGKIVNYPTTNGDKFSERSVSDIVYIGY